MLGHWRIRAVLHRSCSYLRLQDNHWFLLSSMFLLVILGFFSPKGPEAVLRICSFYINRLLLLYACNCLKDHFWGVMTRLDTKFSHCCSNTLLVPHTLYENSKPKATCLSSISLTLKAFHPFAPTKPFAHTTSLSFGVHSFHAPSSFHSNSYRF